MLPFFFLLQLLGKNINDFFALIIAAEFANDMGHDLAAAVGTFGKFFGLQSKVASAPFLLAFGHVVSRYCHSLL